MSEREVLLDVQELSVDFRMDRKTTLRAVREVSFQVYKGETLGITSLWSPKMERPW